MIFHPKMSQTIVIHSRKSESVNRVGGEYLVSYKFPRPLQLHEPHFARLIWITNVTNAPVLIYADFLAGQYVDGELEPYLGCSSPSSANSWIPIASTYIPSYGYIRIAKHDGTSIASHKRFSIVFEIASQSWIHGAKGKAIV